MAKERDRDSVTGTTPLGIAKWASLNKPDTQFKKEGEYRVTMLLDGAQAEALKKIIDDTITVSGQLAKADPKNKGKQIKRADPPYKPYVDKDGNATEQTATSAKGTFSATCAGDLQVSGTAEGAFSSGSAALINWKATGTASAPGLTSCSIALTGTAELGVDSIRIPYEGTTCLGRVSGVETLRK